MAAYLPRRERQVKQGKLVQSLSGPLRAYLPDDWIESAGGLATRVAAFPPSGHGLVHDSAGPLSRPFMQGCTGMAPDGEGKRRFAVAFTGHQRLLQGAAEASRRIAPPDCPAGRESLDPSTKAAAVVVRAAGARR